MLIRLRWPDCPLLNPQRVPEPAFFLECTRPEALALTPDLHFLHERQAERHPSWPLCFLVDRTGTRLEAVERTLPYSGMWNSDNPFQALQPVTLTALDELPGLQPVPGHWAWPAELS